jgi:hypothetical protein
MGIGADEPAPCFCAKTARRRCRFKVLNTARIGKGGARAQLARARRDYENARLALSKVLAVNPERGIRPEGELKIGEVISPPHGRGYLLGPDYLNGADYAGGGAGPILPV